VKAASRTQLRWLSVVVVPFTLTAVAALLSSACRVTALDVGADTPVPHDDREEPDSGPDVTEAEAATTLESRLRARCNEEPGPSDDYFSGADLTARMVARWFNCGSAATSSFQDGDGDGIVFQADGGWAFLTWNAARDGFDETWAVDLEHGKFRYYFFVNPDAGGAADSGVGPGDIPLDDTKNRTPLVVYLDRPGTADGNNVTFSKKPRQMNVVESASPFRARYVPID
jgi:hypothetical protein